MAGSTAVYTPAEHELTQILVTEMLAHQFCFPVQWIDTQDVFLRDFSSERVVELGPAETLVNMARKTVKAGYETHDVAKGLRREFLSYKKNADAIYHKVNTADVLHHGQASKTQEVPPTSKPVSTPPQAPIAAAPPATVATPAAVVADVPDRPVSARDILAVVVALTLKKQVDDIPEDQSIKKLCGGRSTLQNEIIGDLTKEFGNLPDQPEDMSIADLAKVLSDSSSPGLRFGPCTNAIVARFASTKLPAGFGATSLRQYLESRWRFREGLQDRALLFAISRQPSSRLAGQKDMESFLDDMAAAVLKELGIDPQSLSGQGAQPTASAAATAISSEALGAFQKEQLSKDASLLEIYAKRCNHDLNALSVVEQQKQKTIDELQSRVDLWEAELGSAYEKGIEAKFDAKKARKYDSYWNWVIQDLVATFAHLVNGTSLADKDDDIATQLVRFQTRATPRLLDAISYLDRCLACFPDGQNKEITRAWIQCVRQACVLAQVDVKPIFKFTAASTAPVLKIDDRGKITVEEVPRDQASDLESVSSLKDVDDISSPRIGGYTSASSTSASAMSMSVASLTQTTRSTSSSGSSTAASMDSPFSAPVTPATEVSRVLTLSSLVNHCPSAMTMCAEPVRMPQIKTNGPNDWQRNQDLTRVYLQWFQDASSKGISFANTTVLVTGAGQRSIGAEIVRLLLSAGAKVLVTTNSYSTAALEFYEELYRQHGARQSQLVVVPFNGGSQRDTENLVQYIYNTLAWDLDHIVPFAAVGEAGRPIDNIDGHSEIAHRVMLTNLVRLLGAVKAAKASRQIVTHPTHVVLPLSPNHGTFGQDGLYGESKIGLKALLNKWWSEDWSDFLTLCGAVIGWTRGTGLMSNNDILATGIEEQLGIRTFSATEMAWHVVGLMHGKIKSACDLQPLEADLSGGLQAEMNLRQVLDQIQDDINRRSEVRKAIAHESAVETASTPSQAATLSAEPQKKLNKRALLRVGSWIPPSYKEIEPLASQLEGMVDLDRVVVVVGFGEIGPCGSARTRWEAEISGTFSISGCVELAWIMGLVKYHNGPLQGKDYCGWLEAKTKAPITDAEIKAKYESYMVENTGIRLVSRQDHDDADPGEQQLLHEVSVTEDLEPFEVSPETAEDFRRKHGDKVAITTSHDGQQVFVRPKKGMTLWIPKAAKTGLAIGAQVPSGWDPRIYGIPEETISQVDPVTLYAIISTVEAFLSAGITDPFELYNHMHVSDLGNAVGASLGGLKSLHDMYKQRFLEKQIQKDILAETFVNTTAAWINMLLLGSSGPIRTPVGACATSLESVDSGYDLIMNGRAKAVLVGGTDSLERDVAREFANMQATIDADADKLAGRVPKQASRPTASSRAGFVEGEGCGIQLLTTARLAVDMGLPIHGIIALTHTASDTIGRSVPAPGKGILTIAAESRPCRVDASPPVVLDIGFRRRQLLLRRQQIEETRAMEHLWLQEELKATTTNTTGDAKASEPGAELELGSRSTLPSTPRLQYDVDEYAKERRRYIDTRADGSLRDALSTYGNDFWRRSGACGSNDCRGCISPLRGALAVWGLTIDDLSVASLHGTSTVKNDINETDVLQRQLVHLGRTKGNVLPCVCQKSLLGHGKGAAGAFALNGCLQMLNEGLVPGNRNADNIDAALADRDRLFFPARTMRAAGGIKAFSVTSFGFGQKGAQIIGVHAKYLFATLSEGDYEAYRARVQARRSKADRFFQDGLYGGRLVNLKEKSAYDDAKLEEALLTR